nr:MULTISPECIES: Asp-tRNA(Asn)/Glu-tRNA(Gln) amidotransferase subunit GatC [Desertifilum]
MSIIDREQVRKVARLARLEISETEETQFSTQLSDILEYFEQLSELDTSEVPPTTRAIDVSNITRLDELKPEPNRDNILNCAPDQDGDFFKVPQILSEE